MNICNTIMTSQIHVHIPRMNRMSLVWMPLTPFYFIFTYGNILYVRPHYQEQPGRKTLATRTMFNTEWIIDYNYYCLCNIYLKIWRQPFELCEYNLGDSQHLMCSLNKCTFNFFPSNLLEAIIYGISDDFVNHGFGTVAVGHNGEVCQQR
jgi:hypothetical protein